MQLVGLPGNPSRLLPCNSCSRLQPYYSQSSKALLILGGTLKIIEGSLEVKLPTIWTDEKQSREEAERRERLEERRVRRKKMQMREKVGKSRNTVFFQ